MLINFCTNCGTKRLADSQKFCGQCGGQFPEDIKESKMSKISEKFGFPKQKPTSTQSQIISEGIDPNKKKEEKFAVNDYTSEGDNEDKDETEDLITSPSLSRRIKYLKESLFHAKDDEKDIINQDINIMENIAEALRQPFAIRAVADDDDDLDVDPEVLNSRKIKAIREQHEHFKKILNKNGKN